MDVTIPSRLRLKEALEISRLIRDLPRTGMWSMGSCIDS